MTSRAPGITELVEEALVVAQRELAVDLAHQLEGHADRDEDARAGEPEGAHPGRPQQQVREDGDDGDEHGTRKGDPVDDLGQVALGLRAWTDAGDEPALAPDLVG